MEFLGDRVLNLAITEELIRLHPDWTPGQLAEEYSRYTRNTDDAAAHGGPLYRIAKEFRLLQDLTLEEPIDYHGARGKTRDTRKKTKEWKLSDHFEAVVGAMYLDSGNDSKTLNPIIINWFRPLGLGDAHLHSEDPDFGRSVAGYTTVDIWSQKGMECDGTASAAAGGGGAAASEPDRDFLDLIRSGKVEELKRKIFKISTKTAGEALELAILTTKSNVAVPYLLKKYFVRSAVIIKVLEEILAAENETHSIKGHLIKFLREKKGIIYRQKRGLDAGDGREEDPVSEAEAEIRFLDLAQRGNHQALMKFNVPISAVTIRKGLESAVRAGKENVATWITTAYSESGAITPKFIRSILAHCEMSERLSLFFQKYIDNSSGRNFSPLRYRENSVPPRRPPQEFSFPFRSFGRREGGAYASRPYS